MEVKISELPAWIGRRNKSIGAIYDETIRNIWRAHYLYQSGPTHAGIIKVMFRFIFAFMFAK